MFEMQRSGRSKEWKEDILMMFCCIALQFIGVLGTLTYSRIMAQAKYSLGYGRIMVEPSIHHRSTWTWMDDRAGVRGYTQVSWQQMYQWQFINSSSSSSIRSIFKLHIQLIDRKPEHTDHSLGHYSGQLHQSELTLIGTTLPIQTSNQRP